MSDKSFGEDSKSQCLASILKVCLNGNALTELAILLRDHKCISKDQRKEVCKLVNYNEHDEAVRKICGFVAVSKKGWLGVLPVCSDEDFPAGGTVAQLIAQLVGEMEIRRSLAWILTSWRDLLTKQEAMKELVAELRQEQPGEDWLLDFSHWLATSGNLEIEEKFVREARNILNKSEKESKLSEKPEEEDDDSDSMDVDPVHSEEVPGHHDVAMESDGSEEGNRNHNPDMSIGASSFEFVNSEDEAGKPSPDEENVEHDSANARQEIEKSYSPQNYTVSAVLSEYQVVREDMEQTFDSSKMHIMPGRRNVEGMQLVASNTTDAPGEQQLKISLRQPLIQGFNQSLGPSDASSFHLTTPENSSHESGACRLPSAHEVPAPDSKIISLPEEAVNSYKDENPRQSDAESCNIGSPPAHEGPVSNSEITSMHEETGNGNEEEYKHAGSYKFGLPSANYVEVPDSKIPSVPEELIQTNQEDILQRNRADQRNVVEKSLLSQAMDVQQPGMLSPHRTDQQATDIEPSEQAITGNAATDYIRAKSSSRSSDTSETSEEEDENIAWLGQSFKEVQKYHRTVKLVVKLMWPNKRSLLEDEYWLYKLIELLENTNNKQLIKDFVMATKLVINCTKIQNTTPVKENKKSAAGWMRSRLTWLKESQDKIVILTRLGWPNDPEMQDKEKCIEQLFEKTKEEGSTFNNFVSVAKIIIEHVKDVDLENPKTKIQDTFEEKKTSTQDSRPITSNNEGLPSKADTSIGKDVEEPMPAATDVVKSCASAVTKPPSEDADSKPITMKNEEPSKLDPRTDGDAEQLMLATTTVAKSHAAVVKKAPSADAEQTKKKGIFSLRKGSSKDKMKESDSKMRRAEAGTSEEKKDGHKAGIFKRLTKSQKEKKGQAETGIEGKVPPPVLVQKKPMPTTGQAGKKKSTHTGTDREEETFYDALSDVKPLIISPRPALEGEVEFRVYHASSDPEVSTMFLAENCWHDWKPLEMQYDRKRKLHFLYLPVPEKRFTLQYKYLLGIKNQPCVWEHVPYGPQTNRVIILQKDSNVGIVHDIPVFKSEMVTTQLWTDYMKGQVWNLLPSLDEITLQVQGEKADHFPLRKEVYLWVNRMKNGWRTSATHYHQHYLSNAGFETSVLQWLMACQAVENQDDITRQILATMSMGVALHLLKHNISEAKLLQALFRGMSLHQLDMEHQRLLYAIASAEFASKSKSASQEICDMLLWLFSHLQSFSSGENPITEWLLDLPLYWMMANRGDIKTKITCATKESSLLWSRSALPTTKNISWDTIQDKCRTCKSHQRSLLGRVHEIFQTAKLHRWILSSYLYMLSDDSLLSLITDEHGSEIGVHFPVDSVVNHLLFGWSRAHKHKASKGLLNVEKAEDYFIRYTTTTIASSSHGLGAGNSALDKCAGANRSVNLIQRVVMDLVDSYEAMDRYILCLLRIANHFTEMIHHLVGDESDQSKQCRETVFIILSGLLERISHFARLDDCEIKFTNTLFSMRWSDETLQKRWTELLKEEFSKKMAKVWKGRDEDFLDYYSKDVEKMNTHESLETCFEAYAFRCTERLLRDLEKRLGEEAKKGSLQKVSSFLWRENISSPRFAKLLGQLFLKEYAKVKLPGNTQDCMKSMYFAKHWTFTCRFLQLFYKEDAAKSFTTEVSEKVHQVVQQCHQVLSCLKSANVKIGEARFLIENKANIQMLFDVLQSKSNEGTSVDHSFTQMISITEARVKACDTVQRNVSIFKNLCSALEEVRIWVDTEDMEKLCPTSDFLLNRYFTKSGAETDEIKLMAVVTKLSLPTIKDLAMICSLSQSQIFDKFWKTSALENIHEDEAEGNEDDQYQIDWEEVITTFWKDVELKLKSFIEKIINGSATISTLEKYIKVPECTEYTIFQDLSCISQLGINREETMEQDLQDQLLHCSKHIQYIFDLQKFRSTAITYLALRDMLDLQGDFSQLENIQKVQDEADTPMSEIRMTGQEDYSTILKNDDNFTELLHQFSQQRSLVTWLKKKMADLSEVKVYCDLAMISAGETSYEVDRVSCLLSAVMGFAPLIFDLNNNSNLHMLIDKCKVVWANYQADQKLIKKWTDTGRQLSWFQGIQKFHGSVETQSLTLAQEINRHGTYFIHRRGEGPAVLDRCVELAIQEESGEKRDTKTFSEVHDLQSKLVLIAGEAEQGQQEVSKFNKNLAAVENLAREFVNLINAGCMLFSSWHAWISCEDDHIVVSISFGEAIQPLSNTICLKDLEQLADVLKDAHRRWLNYLNNMRLEYYYLNDYNIQQITYLCERLAKNNFSDQVYSLLSSAPKHELFDPIRSALDEATRISNDELNMFDEEPDTVEEGEEEDVQKLKRQMVRSLVMKDELEEDLAKAAVQCEENKDIEDCEAWALLNQHNRMLIRELCAAFDQEEGFAEHKHETQDYTSLLHDRRDSTLKGLIGQIQTKSSSGEWNLCSIINTICKEYFDKTSKLTLQDFLSIEHLGKFLFHLRTRTLPQQPINREMAAPMQTGKPNLIICPTHDILHTVLSLYMTNPKYPLPTRSEVLVCSENTGSDEVERFMRRAMCRSPTKGKEVFCIAYADRLAFTVATTVENTFNNLNGTAYVDPNYQLIILASAQQHYLVTCFDKNQVESKQRIDVAKISNYLLDKLESESKPSGNTTVRIVASKRSGVGKSLHVRRLQERMGEGTHYTTIRLLEGSIDLDHVMQHLCRTAIQNQDDHLVHFDLSPAVQRYDEIFFFNLFILGSVEDTHGRIWRHLKQHVYIVEVTESQQSLQRASALLLQLLPRVQCLCPTEVLKKYKEEAQHANDIIMMDEQEFGSEIFQRPYQYLKKVDAKENLDAFQYTAPSGTAKDCIQTLLKYCGMRKPSWAQLKYFARFLNIQLANCEKSFFCQKISASGSRSQDISFPGLKSFAVGYMIKMAQDFATPSLSVSDESVKDVDELDQYKIRRHWEDEIHPFVFFNADGVTMTFINVNIDKDGNLLDERGEVKERNVISKRLVADLKLQGVPLGVEFNKLDRQEKLNILCQFMDIPQVFDPDSTYELTTDNVVKMLAIYVRLWCSIPVIIMGETGCGKTRMIEFMSKLKAGKNNRVKNMWTLKIHGGIKITDVYECVGEASRLALQSMKEFGLSTILFFDEANTTSAIHAIKEVMCDGTIDGESFQDSQLRIVAACNPYKRLSREAVKKLEDSGLGYSVKANESECLGTTPMRTLVYRVVSLPPSMQPMVWDFGQLGTDAEKIYIAQMTKRTKGKLQLSNVDEDVIHAVLCGAQAYVREKGKDEYRYVSLRDVERSLQVFEWFYNHSNDIFPLIIEKLEEKGHGSPAYQLSDSARALLQTIGVSYHASLDERKKFRIEIAKILGRKSINIKPAEIEREFIACQTVFLRNLKMDDNIACNEALRENIFLMAVCTNLRIPLFVVGKPGSSKSLAKTILADNMQGSASHSNLFKKFKQIHILSYQCSGLTDALGIESIFKQCSQLQAKQDLDTYVAVVVLDEIGLAEDSPNMPLKVLHPLLECGSTMNGTLTEFDPEKKVGFVGISNWALDPAKMNRGIFVTRSKPDKKDLKRTAKGIFENQTNRLNAHVDVIDALTDTYLELYNRQKKEYFGLRDYYCLIKMIHALCKSMSFQRSPCRGDIEKIILRNFSGGEKSYFETFSRAIEGKLSGTGTGAPLEEMILDNLSDDRSRFLLLLANQYSAVGLLQTVLENYAEKVQVIFGSSFPNDHSYTELCRNINRIKVCMETGRTVILLNMAEINESLYDALNQHYVTLGGQRYVDLGLGGHRVKCRIAEGFRLIIIEVKEKVYNEYPIPLINRLEKHHLTSQCLLTHPEKATAKALQDWVHQFFKIQESKFSIYDAFLGYHDDTVGSIVISSKSDIDGCKDILLQSATMDAVFRLPKRELARIQATYIEQQMHDSLERFLANRLNTSSQPFLAILEITSFSNVLSDSDRREIVTQLGLNLTSVMLLSLQQFQTEQDYHQKIDEFLKSCTGEVGAAQGNAAVLLIQCPQAHNHEQLIACARHGLMNKLGILGKKICKKVIIAFLLSTQRKLSSDSQSNDKVGLTLQHTSQCEIVYIDELRPTLRSMSLTTHFHQKTICEVLELGKNSINPRRESNELGLHMPTLIQDCICEAMAKIKTGGECNRGLKRVEILFSIFSEDCEVNYHFLSILLNKMVDIYHQREDEMGIVTGMDWVAEEAHSAERLQEGGTFGKTLWLCLKHHVANLLAFIISNIDQEDNLDIILNQHDTRMHNMWLEMFDACVFSWIDMRGAKEFGIKRLPKDSQRKQQGLKIPFSFLLHDSLELEWTTVESGHVGSDMQKMFFNRFHYSCKKMMTAISNVLALPKPTEVIHAFAEDLIRRSFNFDGKGDVWQKVAEILVHTSLKLNVVLREQNELVEGDIFLILYFCSKKYYTHLNVILDLLSICPNISLEVKDWIEAQEQEQIFDFHDFALEAALRTLNEGALKIKDADSCKEWMDLARQMKAIFHRVTNLIDDQTRKSELTKLWEPMGMLDLLLLQLLPNSADTDIFNKYVEVMAAHARLLYKGTQKSGVRSQQQLRIVCNVLRKYYEDVWRKILAGWKNTSCGICRKPSKQPVVLPCSHIFCKDCLQKAFLNSNGQRKCQVCSEPLEENYDVVGSVPSKKQLAEISMFQSNCTSFFLEYLSQFCFASHEQNLEVDVVDQIRLVFEQIVLERRSSDHNELEVMAINVNTGTRSSIFCLMFQCNPDMVEEMVNEWLNRPDEIHVANLMQTIIKSFEEIHLIRDFSMEADDNFQKSMKVLSNIMTQRDHAEVNSMATISDLQMISQIRIVLAKLMDAIQQRVNTSGEGCEGRDSFIYSAQTHCKKSSHDVLQKFFIKTGCRVNGSGWFNNIVKRSDCQAFIPSHLKTMHETSTIDYWTVLGQPYTELRAILNKLPTSAFQAKLPELFSQDTNFKSLEKVLAILMWLQKHQQHLSAVVAHFTQHSSDDGNMITFLIDTYRSTLSMVSSMGVSVNLSKQEEATISQLITLICGVVKNQPSLTSQLYLLMTTPSQCTQLFWPAMPESYYFSLPPELRLENGQEATYRCSNGHLYTIGNCTRPYTVSRCPDCKAIIGGKDHEAAAGNERIRLEESSQAGYKLSSEEKNLQDPADRISKQGAALIQLILHSCMAIGLKNQPSSYPNLLPNQRNVLNAQKYLILQIKRNLRTLSEALGRNMDDTILVTYKIVIDISKAEPRNGESVAANWNSIENRKVWEKQFRDKFLLPVFQNLDETITQAQQNLAEAEDLTSMALYRLVHEVGEDDEVPPEVTVWQNPAVWKTLEHSNAAHLQQCILDNKNPGTGQILQIILQTPDIHLVQYLNDVLRLQKRLIARYQNKIDMGDAEKITLHEFLAESGSEHEQVVTRYIDIWNLLCDTLQSSGECDSQMAEWLTEITKESPVSTALPSLRGRGRCAKLLVEHLIEIQNKFLSKCLEVEAVNGSVRDTDISQLMPSHFVCIDEKKDLLPMIRLHTSYDITEDEHGRHHCISYNIDALEKQAREKFVKYKRLIKLKSLPHIKYPQDIGIGSDWGKVIANTKQQEPLSQKLVQGVEDLVKLATSADICEAVRTLTYAISFLAKVPCESSRWLLEYLEKDLLLPKSRATVIPKSAKIHHTLALYQHLTWRKAVNFVQLGLNPYQEALYEVHQEDIKDKKVLSKLTNAFEHMDIVQFQQHVNEMLIQVPDYKEDWSLADEIFPYLLFIGDETTEGSWFEEIPSAICFKHVSHVFKLAVNHAQAAL